MWGGFDPWVGKISWRRKRQPFPGPCLENPHGQRSLVGPHTSALEVFHRGPECGLSTYVWRSGFVAPGHVESSPIKDPACVPGPFLSTRPPGSLLLLLLNKSEFT